MGVFLSWKIVLFVSAEKILMLDFQKTEEAAV